jgi:acetyltransferase-like isoleucine patch superfamily enzyme
MAFLRIIYFGFFSVINNIWLKINKVSYSSITINGFLLLYNKGSIVFGKNLKINSHSLKNIIGGDTRSSIIVKKKASLQIGENFKMSNSAIYCAEKITIGDNVMIGGSCRIWDTDFHPLDSKSRMDNPNEDYSTKPIVIADNVFIGGFSIILKGVVIGDGSIIGAGSVVSKSVPPGEIWGGNPAAFIKKINTNGHSEKI